jgi:redox-sensitive bicupin YhaK (pirin superfamily)
MIDIRRANERFHTRIGWLDSWHSFSFSMHYDPANTRHGLLLVHNDDTVSAGAGFTPHAHADMEIVTWVLEGRLAHEDSTGHEGVLYPGLAQRMSAGTGIRHSEMNASRDEPVRFVQMWVPPDTTGIAPGYEQCDVNDALEAGGLVVVASGRDDRGGADTDGERTGVHIHQRGAVLRAGRLRPGAPVEVPSSPRGHVFVAVGSARLGDEDLARGDAARLTDEPALPLEAGPEGAEVLIWSTD